MPTRLILNADDFGLTPGVNRAIQELHHAGVLTSATLMASAAAFDDAVAIARATPTLGVGCHIILVDGTPISHPASIPSLIGPDGQHFRTSLADFAQALLRGRVRESDIEREASAQVRKLQRAGIEITHLDTHKHTHMFPTVTRSILRVAENSSIRAIRNPFEPKWCRNLGQGNFLRRLQLTLLNRLRTQFQTHPQIRNGDVLTTAGSAGVSATGQLNSESLRRILTAAPEGLWEVVLHPGYNDTDLATIATRLRTHRDIEREALLSVVPRFLLQPNPPELIHYGDPGRKYNPAIHTPDTSLDDT